MKTVDKIMRKFRKAIDELEKTADRELKKAMDFDEKIQRLESDRDWSLNENKRAINIAHNIRRLCEDAEYD